MREKNNHYKGTRNDSDKINFLGGLVFCKECSNSLVRYSCGIKNQRYHYLVCSSAKYGSHKMVLFNYQKIQETFIMAIFKCNFFNDFLDSKRHTIDNKNIEALNGKLIEIQSRINKVCDSIEVTKSKDLNLRLISLQSDREKIENEIISLNKLTSDHQFNFSTQELFLKTVLQDIDDNVFRIRLRSFLRSIIESIVIWKDDDLKGIVAYVRFKDSSDKITIMFKDKGNFSAVILLNNKTVSFSNSKSAAWFNDQGNPQDIDPFFLKEHVGRDENNKPKEIAKIDTANFLLKQN